MKKLVRGLTLHTTGYSDQDYRSAAKFGEV